MKRLLTLCAVFLLSSLSTFAQTGFPPYGSFEDGRFDAINRQNLNFNFAIPVVSVPARGIGFGFGVLHNSLIWKKSSGWYPVLDANGNPTWGWNFDNPTGVFQYGSYIEECEEFPGQFATAYYDYWYTDPAGTVHQFNVQFYNRGPFHGYCPWWNTGPRTGYAIDGSGYYLDATSPTSPFVLAPDGTKIKPDGTLIDTNGNFISKIVISSTETHWKDSAGRIALKIQRFTGSASCGTGNDECIRYLYRDGNNGEQTIQLNLKTFAVKTNFGCSGVGEYNQTGKLLPTSVSLPNGQSYTFEYENTPNLNPPDPTKFTARVKKVTLPTGGSYEYVYPSGPSDNNGIECSDGTVKRLTRKINLNDQTTLGTWEFTRSLISGTNWKTLISAPPLPYDLSVPNETVYTFDGTKQTSQKVYQGTEAVGMLLRTVNTTWAANGTPSAHTLILNDTNQQSKTEPVFDSNGNLTELREYPFGSGAPGATPVRTTQITYLSTSAYTSRNILNRPTQILVRDGGATGTIKSRTNITYDGTTPFPPSNCPSDAVQHDNTNYGCSFLTRGNPISVTSYTNASVPSGTITQTLEYDSLGNLRKTTDAQSHIATLSYADSWSFATCAPTGTTYAYLTSVTNALSQATSLAYNSCLGLVGSVTDPNGRMTSFSYLDSLGNADKFGRLRKVDFPDTGQTKIDYNDPARTVTTTVKRTDSANIVVTDLYDQLGLLTERQLPGSRKVKVTYDPLGRQLTVTNPHINITDSTYGLVETQVDALGRVKLVKKQDLAQVVFTYAGNATKVTDEANKKRIVETDALGRVTKVCEVTAGNTRSAAESCAMGSFLDTGYVITNTYDVLDNLTQLVQGPAGQQQTRTMTYDSLSRITSAIVPEVSTGTGVTYGYDNDSNQTIVADPRGTVNLEYDALHRITRKKHGTTVVAEFTYDGTAANNAIGRLITETDGPVGTADKCDYTYDALGRVKTANRTVSSVTYNLAYEYDLMGSLTKLTYPSGRVVEYVYSAAVELNKVTDATNPSARYDYVTGTVYSPLGPLEQVNFGNAVRTTLAWNKRGLTTSILTEKQPQPPGPAHLNLGYTYYANGQIQEITNVLDGLKSEKYTYDELLRLFTAQRGPDANIQRKYSYDYDRFGNRWNQTLVAGSGYGGGLNFNSANNRITDANFSYDGSGNLINAGAGTSFIYNQENFMTAASSTTYKVDAQGRRVQKMVSGATTDYFYSGSEVISEKQGSAWTDYIFFGDQRIAKQTGSTLSTTTFSHPDHLGSTRRCTNSSGDSAGTCDFEPFGEIQPGSTCSVPTNYRFAAMEWDADAGPNGLYKTWFRYYDPTQGRWMGVDPLAGALEDPQSLNRYAYVQNDPPNRVDPLGACAFYVTSCQETAGSYVCEAVGYFCGGDGGSQRYPCDDGRSRMAPSLPPCPGGGGAPDGGDPGGGILSKVKSALCSSIPEGRTIGVSHSRGALGGVTGSAEVVLNYNTGEASVVFAGGGFAGWNGVASSSVSTSLLFNLGESNARYSGGFTTLSGGGVVGGFISQSSGGLSSPASLDFTGVTAVGVNASATLVGSGTGTISATNYSQPIPLGRLGSVLAFASSPLDALGLLVRQACR